MQGNDTTTMNWAAASKRKGMRSPPPETVIDHGLSAAPIKRGTQVSVTAVIYSANGIKALSIPMRSSKPINRCSMEPDVVSNLTTGTCGNGSEVAGVWEVSLIVVADPDGQPSIRRCPEQRLLCHSSSNSVIASTTLRGPDISDEADRNGQNEERCDHCVGAMNSRRRIRDPLRWISEPIPVRAVGERDCLWTQAPPSQPTRTERAGPPSRIRVEGRSLSSYETATHQTPQANSSASKGIAESAARQRGRPICAGHPRMATTDGSAIASAAQPRSDR